MKFLPFQNEKEYDGPTVGAKYPEKPSTGPCERSAQLTISNQSFMTTSLESSIPNERIRQIDKSSVERGGTARSDTKNEGTKVGRRNKLDRSQPLASGISSRRTTTMVTEHLAANVMSGKAHPVGANGTSGTMARKESLSSSSGGPSSLSNTLFSQVPPVMMTPMEHDGGILCIEPIPRSLNDNRGTMTHRFLTGSVDGTIKLWSLQDNQKVDLQSNYAEMIPKIIRTYQGHKSYIHQIAYLGSFNPRQRTEREKKGRELFVSASRDNTLRIWEVADEDGSENDVMDRICPSQNSPSHGKPNVYSKMKGDCLISKGRKLRGHHFGSNDYNSAGVLCVCSVPSLSDFGVALCNRAGQFASGGCDGVVRVWDVRYALGLENVPKSGVYSTVQIQCLGEDMISVTDESSEFKEEDDDNNLDGHYFRSPKRKTNKKNSSRIPVTSIVCTGNKLDTIALFAADSKGTIRRYSPANTDSIGYVNNSIWWSFTGIFPGGSFPVVNMTILNSPKLTNLMYGEKWECYDKGNVKLLVSASLDGCISVWDAFDVLTDAQLKASETDRSLASGKIQERAALWKIQLNHEDDNDMFATEPSFKNVSAIDPFSRVTSLTSIQGRRLLAGTTDGLIHMWDASLGQSQGSYAFDPKIQIWSCATLSDIEYESGGEMTSVGIVASGDNRGRLRILRIVADTSQHGISKMSTGVTRPKDTESWTGQSRTTRSSRSSRQSKTIHSGNRRVTEPSMRQIREVEFG